MSFSGEKLPSSSFGYSNITLGVNDDKVEYAPLSWRLDPDTSMSDWTIQIARDDQDDNVYYVHKIMLVIGPCKSDYFVSAFRSSQLQKGRTSTSQIPLQKAAARVIPKLLDFVYTKELDIDTNQAGALRYLSGYFQMKLLYCKVMEFIHCDMDMTNIHIYIQDAVIFDDDDLMALAGALIVKNIHLLDPTSHLLETIDPNLFLQIIASPESKIRGMSCNLVSAYCQLHQGEILSEVFDDLTNHDQLPLIEKEAALIFLELQSRLFNNQSNYVSCIQNCCIDVLAHHWQEYCSLSTTSPIQSFSSPVLVEFIQKTLTIANLDIEELKSRLESEMKVNLLELQNRMADAIGQAQEHLQHSELRNCDLLHEVTRLVDVLSERQAQLALYQQEWSKLHCAPAPHSFIDTQVCTYHHQPEAGPFGKREPTGMPQIGQLPEDRYLYLQKNGNQFDRWPVLYYKDCGT